MTSTPDVDHGVNDVRGTALQRKLSTLSKTYLGTWWLPPLLFLIILGAVTFIDYHWHLSGVISDALATATVVAFLGILCAAIASFVTKRWRKGIINLVLLVICAVAAFFAVSFLALSSMFGPSEDGFADNLEIPTNIPIAEPRDELKGEPGVAKDTFQSVLLAALKTPGSKDPTITGNISSLVELHRNAPGLLRRYLAANPTWRVFVEDGNIVATRRWMIRSEWRFTLHGYYSRGDIDTWSTSGTHDFQSRFTIGLSGKPWWHGNKTTWLKAGETAQVKVSEGNRMNESHCVIKSDAVVVEVFEESDAPERRLTKAALQFTEREFAALLAEPTWETVRRILPEQSIRTDKASLDLRRSFQPGLYESVIWANPAEPGMIYLKAFEVTKGTPLSENRLKEASNEWIGWSQDGQEVFFSNTHFTIYEGDWGKPYAARFEVWFVPDSGRAERKLIDRVFKIEGWQR